TAAGTAHPPGSAGEKGRMRSELARVTLSYLAASAVVAILVTGFVFLTYDRVGAAILVGAVIFCLGFLNAVLLGFPAYLFLNRIGLVRWWTALAAGFLLGSLPMAVILWLEKNHARAHKIWRSDELIHYLASGAPADNLVTPQFVASLCVSGLMGMIGGLTAWLVWHRTAPQAP
nr:hypothetical protein [Pseudomonadota bacterium]